MLVILNKIADRQSLLLANISSCNCTVYDVYGIILQSMVLNINTESLSCDVGINWYKP